MSSWQLTVGSTCQTDPIGKAAFLTVVCSGSFFVRDFLCDEGFQKVSRFGLLLLIKMILMTTAVMVIITVVILISLSPLVKVI